MPLLWRLSAGVRPVTSVRVWTAAAPAERAAPPADLLQRLAQLESELADSRQLRARADRAAAENHKLRAGLQEILQSIRRQDGQWRTPGITTVLR